MLSTVEVLQTILVFLGKWAQLPEKNAQRVSMVHSARYDYFGFCVSVFFLSMFLFIFFDKKISVFILFQIKFLGIKVKCLDIITVFTICMYLLKSSKDS